MPYGTCPRCAYMGNEEFCPECRDEGNEDGYRNVLPRKVRLVVKK